MAISAATVFECRASGASDNNGGGFVAGSGGTDWSQANAVQVAVGGGVVTSSITTTVVTFTGSTYTVLAGDVGNIVQFLSGTNVVAGFYQIASVSAGLNGTWTLDRTPLTSGTTTNAVANMGGALATLGKLSGAMVASNKAYCTGAFTSTATITFAQTSAAIGGTRVIGYGATRGDSTHATLTLSTNTGLTGLIATGTEFSFEQIDVDCGSLGTSTGISIQGSFSRSLKCKVANFTTAGITIPAVASCLITACEVTGGTAAATAGINLAANNNEATGCFVHDNVCTGILGVSSAMIRFNLCVNNSGASSDGIQASYNSMIYSNTCHNNGRHGINLNNAAYRSNRILNNILTSNGGFGLSGTGVFPADPDWDGNAYYNNTSGTRNNFDAVTGLFAVTPYTNVRDVILTASPYVGPTTGSTANFALNNTAGAGRSCKKAGSPGTWTGNTGTTGYLDMGAVQSKGTGRVEIIH